MASRGNIAEAGRLLDWKPVSAVGIAVLFAIVWASDMMRPIHTVADADVIFAYESLLINGGQPQDYFDHTGYIYFLVLSLWTRLLHIVGLIGPFRLQDFKALSPSDFETAYFHIVVAGRWLSFVVASGFIVLIWHVVHALTLSRPFAAVAALLFAASPGLAIQAMILRPELPTSLLAFSAFATLLAASHARRWRAPALIALAAFLAMASMMTKVQIAPVLVALPILAIAFGQHQPALAFPWNRPGANWLAPTAVLAALAFGLPALTMIFGRAFIVSWAVYQTGIVVIVAASIFVYARLYQIDRRTAVITAAAVLTGLSTAQYLHLITNQIQNTEIVANFIEHMTAFVTVPDANAQSQGMFAALAGRLLATTLRPFQPGSAAGFPFHLAFWLALPGIAYLAWRRAYRSAVQGLLLLGLAYAIEVYCGLRTWHAPYYVLATPWLICGVAVVARAVIDELAPASPKLHFRKGTIAVALCAVAWIGGQSLNLAFAERRWQDPSNICGQKAGYLHQLPEAFSERCK